METEQELNKILAEWRFPDNIVKVYLCAIEVWSSNKRDELITIINPFTKDETACFKWLVPKYIAEICKLPLGLVSIMSIYAFLFTKWLKFLKEGLEPAPALCKAIEKLIGDKDV